jgi:hypothetical protein
MNREQMVERAMAAQEGPEWPTHPRDIATAILDAIMPQVTTVEELEALPIRAVLISRLGITWGIYPLANGAVLLHPTNQKTPRFIPEVVLRDQGPLTVVWTPEP